MDYVISNETREQLIDLLTELSKFRFGAGGSRGREAVNILPALNGAPVAVKPTVLVVRDPDSATSITVSPVDSVVVVEADLGSSFDGRPNTGDEADVAEEIAASLDIETAHLPAGDPVREAAMAISERLQEQANEILA